MRQIRAKLVLAIFVVGFLTGCSLLDPPPAPAIPTPPPLAPAVSFSELQLVTNPTSSIAPSMDPDIAALMNAVSTQQLQAYVQTLESFETRNTFSSQQRDDYGIGAAARWLHDEFVRVGGRNLVVEFDDFQANINGLTTSQRNIIATLPGISDHPGIILVMAHYDSRGEDPNNGSSPAPGANDNGSGVALLLEIARLLSSRQWNQTIIFAAFAAEEQGTFGSRHFVQDRILDGYTFDAAIDNDIIGGRSGIPQAIRVFSPGPETHFSRQLARYVELVSSLYLPTFRIELIDRLDREGRFGDHREFINAGVPAIRFTESEEDRDRQHNNRDIWQEIDLNYLRQVTQLNLAVIANMAGAPPPPAVPTIAPMADPGSYILTWLPDARSAGYAISFRPVESPSYAPFRFISTADAGNVALTDLDPNMTYAVSLAAIDVGGRLSSFSQEIIVGPLP